MKKNEKEQLKKKSPTELVKEIQTSKDKLWSLKVDLAAGKVKNVREINELKKNIARMKGLLTVQKAK